MAVRRADLYGNEAPCGSTSERFMENLTLVDAYARFGAKAANRLRALSAIAEDGAMVLSCSPPHFGRAAKGVLRYEDRLSREAEPTAGNQLLAQHLARARDGELPVRMVVVAAVAAPSGKVSRNIHVRADLVGKVTKFDGDHFIVEFTREAVAVEPARRRG